MRKFLCPLVVVLFPGLLFLVGGCAEGPTSPESDLTSDSQLSPEDEMEGSKVGNDQETALDMPESTVIEVGKTFSVSLESNPTTGYSWQAEFDPKYLQLISKEFVIDSKLVGAGGVEKYKFLALKQGQVEVTMTYKRPWENQFEDQQSTLVKIVPEGQ